MTSPGSAYPDVVFLSGARTGFGSFGGTLKDLSATDLGGHRLAAPHSSARGVPGADVDHVIFGNVLQTSADAIYLARHIGLQAGLPIEVPAVTVNRLCGSGFEAIIQGAQQILLGESRRGARGRRGVHEPGAARGPRRALGPAAGPGAPLEDSLWEALSDSQCGLSMAETAENLADAVRHHPRRKWMHTRSRARSARSDGLGRRAPSTPRSCRWRFTNRKKARPSSGRPTSTCGPTPPPRGSPSCRPISKKDGVVTAGNASGIGDGAAALVLASAEYAAEQGPEAARPPRRLGHRRRGPGDHGHRAGPAARKALGTAGLTLDADGPRRGERGVRSAVSCGGAASSASTASRTNVNGGAIALGHPLGASGARITLHLLHALRRRGGRYGLGSACIGGGQGAAVIVEAFPDEER